MSLRNIKNRIRSIKNTSQITKAMEMVAASKMRRAQEFAINTRFYTIKAIELLLNLIQTAPEIKHYLIEEAKSDKVCFLVITSDKGLCGGFNSFILNLVLEVAQKYGRENIDIIAVGKKGADFLKNKKFNIAVVFSEFGDHIELEDTSPVARLLMEYQKNGKYKETIVFYNKFISTLKQTVSSHGILPLNFDFLRKIVKEIIPESGRYSEFKKDFLQAEIPEHNRGSKKEPGSLSLGKYIIEPSTKAVMENMLPSLFEVEVHYLILESNASEHSARMVAMKNASDNAKDILEELRLIYNKARQANITKELSEISAGAEALK